MDDGVDAFEEAGRKFPDVGVVLTVERGLGEGLPGRNGEARSEEALVDANQFRRLSERPAQVLDEYRAEIWMRAPAIIAG